MDKDALRSVFSDASRNGWSLRSDVQLQEWLEAFAEQLKRRTKEVAAEVHRLGTETGNVELLLQNNFNSLRALSATQFIENRVDEVDEVPMNKSEQPTKQSRIESYDAQIVPRYKEAVLTAWDAFQGFSSRKSSQEFSDVTSRTHQALPTKKLPHIIGTEEFMRDDHCGLADFKIPEVNARAPSSEPVESGSDTDRDEARMAADMVGDRPWLDGEWFASGSETSEHQGGVLEPAVSAALDFKAMLEAALRGPSFPYDGGIMSNLENEHEQHSYVDNPTILVSRDTESKSPSSLAGQDPVQQRSELHEDSSTKHEEPPVEHNTQLQSQHNLQHQVQHNMQHQSQGFASEFLEQLSRTVLMQPPPITVCTLHHNSVLAFVSFLFNVVIILFLDIQKERFCACHRLNWYTKPITSYSPPISSTKSTR
jgi:WASH complex subunit FAM21